MNIKTDVSGVSKICSKCGVEHPIEKFSLEGKNRYDKFGNPARRSHCNICRNIYRCDKKRPTIKPVELKAGDDNFEYLFHALVELSRYDKKRLASIDKDEFTTKTNSADLMVNYSYPEIKAAAFQCIQDLGMANPKEVVFDNGRYLIVGDSHGKHTKTKMFNLIKGLNKHLEFNKIIHVGHILDDDNIISYWWKDFNNLIVLARIEELEKVQKAVNDDGFKFDIIRKSVLLGNLHIQNQEQISDYVKISISSLDQIIYNQPTVVNCHRQEYDTRCSYNEPVFYASPGCLCEEHIVKTIKQIDFTSGYQVREARPFSFSKYRRMDEMDSFWEQGCLIVDVIDGEYTITPCRIQKVGEEYALSYFDKIYVGNKVVSPTKKMFVNADMHCDLHDSRILDLQEQVVKEYCPDVYVNLGDLMNNKALNHHDLSKGHTIDKSYLEEYKSYYNLIDRLTSWAPEIYLIRGNHERFMVDFYSKFPQMKDLLESFFLAPLEKNNWRVVEGKDVLELNGVKFIHGDLTFFGQNGKNVEKIARTFGENSIVGHSHYTAIRFGCHLIGFSGMFDQGYNDVNGSRWNHGFALVNIYKGVPFINNYSVKNYAFILNNQQLIGKDTFKNKKNNIKIDFE